MVRSPLCFLALGVAALPFAAPASAQDEPARGIYVVARGGASINPDQKLDVSNLPASSTFSEKTKYKTGVTGQIGGGYDFGMFRIEQTVGYTSSDLKLDDAQTGGFAASGKTKSLSMSVAGYVDIPVSTMFVPYVGGGIGGARVEANLARVTASGVGSSYSGKDWGMMWHADAGIGINIRPKTTLEIGGRYTQTSSLKFDGQNAGIATVYEPKLRNLSGTVGIRHIF